MPVPVADGHGDPPGKLLCPIDSYINVKRRRVERWFHSGGPVKKYVPRLMSGEKPMRIIRFLGLCFGLVGFSGLADAGARELKFITVETAPWASYDQESGEPVGAFPDLVAEIERRSEFRIKMALRPFTRINPGLESGDQDCTIILWHESRAPLVERGAAVFPMAFGVVAHKNAVLKEYDDLTKLTISQTRGLKITRQFDEDERLVREYDRNYKIGLHKMAHNRLDAVAGVIPTILFMAGQEGLAEELGDYLVMKNHSDHAAMLQKLAQHRSIARFERAGGGDQGGWNDEAPDEQELLFLRMSGIAVQVWVW